MQSVRQGHKKGSRWGGKLSSICSMFVNQISPVMIAIEINEKQS